MTSRSMLVTLAVIIAAVTARVLALALSPTDLYPDEAQYWYWGQHFAFGYFSKPPLIGWLIGAVTTLAASDTMFWVRLPAPILHGVTALFLALLSDRLQARSGPWAALIWMSLPMVGLGSFLITTDTLMLTGLAAALYVWRLALDRNSVAWAFLAGALLGVAALGKYAAFFLLAGVIIAAVTPRWRPSWAQAGAALAMVFALLAPNLWWNARNGAPTLSHTMDNAGWVHDQVALNPIQAVQFLLDQLAVFGPIACFVLIWALFSAWRNALWRGLIVMSVTPIFIVSIQALLDQANANWGVAAYIPACILLALVAQGWVRKLAIGCNIVICIMIVVLTVAPTILPQEMQARTTDRYLDRAEAIEQIVAIARQNDLDTVVGAERGLLADLFYHGDKSGLALASVPPDGSPRNHYAMTQPLQASGKPVLFVSYDKPPTCADLVDLGQIETEQGSYSRSGPMAWRVLDTCLLP